MNDSLKKLRKELGKPEGVAKVWTTQGKKMIFDFESNGNKVFWEAKIENGVWNYYVKARNKDSVDFVLNVVLHDVLHVVLHVNLHVVTCCYMLLHVVTRFLHAVTFFN